MESILVSACLLGICCRYDGGDCKSEAVIDLKNRYHLIPVCPEIYGGLTTPRDPAERRSAGVFSCKGADVTAQYNKGAQAALQLANLLGCRKAVLKARSPSCGCGQIYDGSFSGILTNGKGVTAELLQQHGILVFSEESLSDL